MNHACFPERRRAVNLHRFQIEINDADELFKLALVHSIVLLQWELRIPLIVTFFDETRDQLDEELTPAQTLGLGIAKCYIS